MYVHLHWVFDAHQWYEKFWVNFKLVTGSVDEINLATVSCEILAAYIITK